METCLQLGPIDLVDQEPRIFRPLRVQPVPDPDKAEPRGGGALLDLARDLDKDIRPLAVMDRPDTDQRDLGRVAAERPPDGGKLAFPDGLIHQR